MSTNIIIDNWAWNQHIRMISEGSCDTEDRNNDVGNSALITFKIILWYCDYISQYYCFYCISDQINTPLVGKRATVNNTI